MTSERVVEINTLSPRDQLLSIPGLRGVYDIIDRICDDNQGLNLFGENEGSGDIDFNLLDNLLAIENLPRAQSEIIGFIAGIIDSGALKPEDLPKLIKRVSYATKADTSTEEMYLGRSGVMSWRNYEILIHEKINDSDLNIDIRHHFGHEIGHSITELLLDSKSITKDELLLLFSDITDTYESAHTLSTKTHDGTGSLFLKERVADLLSIYLSSMQSGDPVAEFGKRRFLLANPEALIENDDCEEFKLCLAESKTLLERTDRFFKQIIRPALSNISLEDRVLDYLHEMTEPLEFDFDFVEDTIPTSAFDEPAMSAPSLAHHNSSADMGISKYEAKNTAPVGSIKSAEKDKNISNQIGNALKDLIKASDELDIFNIH